MNSKIIYICVFLGFLSGCTDTTIEGITPQFKATTATSSFTTLNTCTNSGTTFNVKIDFQGFKSVSSVSYYYEFSSGSSGTVSSASFTNSSNFITVSHCVRFSTSTSITYDYTITNVDGKVTTISKTINKPSGAN